MVTNDGGSQINARGICWSTNPLPTINDNKTSDGKGIGSFTSSIDGLLPGTTYYFRAYATNSISTSYGQQISETTIDPRPIVYTAEIITDITGTTATSSGYVTSDMGLPITARGVCWSTSHNPTITDANTFNGTGISSFTSYLTGLKPNTSYYLRAYATNSAGTGYGAEISFNTVVLSDADGNVYKTIVIGTQQWMAENLKTKRYRNGDLIGTTTNAVYFDIPDVSYPRYQWPCGNDESLVNSYGRLYTWYAANDSREISPSGWHVPYDNEWTVLIEWLRSHNYGYTQYQDDVAKSLASTWGWYGSGITPGSGAVANSITTNNRSGFNAVPSGSVSFSWWYQFNGTFDNFGVYARWWSCIEYNTTNGLARSINSYDSQIARIYSSKRNGFSIRCIKD
jgi:uncharacterized protein (TIGR02145 family)